MYDYFSISINFPSFQDMMRYHVEVNADAAIVRKCLIDEFISLNPNFSANLTKHKYRMFYVSIFRERNTHFLELLLLVQSLISNCLEQTRCVSTYSRCCLALVLAGWVSPAACPACPVAAGQGCILYSIKYIEAGKYNK